MWKNQSQTLMGKKTTLNSPKFRGFNLNDIDRVTN